MSSVQANEATIDEQMADVKRTAEAVIKEKVLVPIDSVTERRFKKGKGMWQAAPPLVQRAILKACALHGIRQNQREKYAMVIMESMVILQEARP